MHTDLGGRTRTRALASERYFILFIVDYSRMTWATFLQDKSQAYERFKILQNMVQKESGYNLRFLRSYRGEEFTSNEFEDYCEKHGIGRQYLA